MKTNESAECAESRLQAVPRILLQPRTQAPNQLKKLFQPAHCSRDGAASECEAAARGNIHRARAEQRESGCRRELRATHRVSESSETMARQPNPARHSERVLRHIHRTGESGAATRQHCACAQLAD